MTLSGNLKIIFGVFVGKGPGRRPLVVGLGLQTNTNSRAVICSKAQSHWNVVQTESNRFQQEREGWSKAQFQASIFSLISHIFLTPDQNLPQRPANGSDICWNLTLIEFHSDNPKQSLSLLDALRITLGRLILDRPEEAFCAHFLGKHGWWSPRAGSGIIRPLLL